MKNKKISTYKKITENNKIKNIIQYFTDLHSFKKTLYLSLLFVFLFYLPFTFLVLVFNQAINFQGDFLYQFSTIIMDFRNRLMHLNFSTWDFRNAIGYDYFANFYYIPLDITLLPFFLFPFLSYTQLMWLSFLFKILLGTAAIAYLLKLYKLKHSTILLVAVLYGTADLFFAQNVFASYSGLTFYIPLILIAIEYMFQKNNFLVFSLVMFQVFLFNSYWAWGLTLFMTVALFFRYVGTRLTFKNLKLFATYRKTFLFFLKSIGFFLLGFGLAGFFVLPLFNIMSNEPRMVGSTHFLQTLQGMFDSIKLSFNKVVYYKEFFKMLVPNLDLYKGYYYDSTASYWVMTNHQIVYSSILASFSLFFFIVYPTFLAKKKLSPRQLKIFITLKVVTILATIMILLPFSAYVFSLNSGDYLRWLVFYGVLLIIDFAFIFDFKLINNTLLCTYLVIASGYLIYSIHYNQKLTSNSGFTGSDETIAYTMVITYIIILLLVLIFDKHMKHQLTLLIERIAGMSLIFSICVSQFVTADANHVNYYGKTVNQLMKNVDTSQYTTTMDFLYLHNDWNENMPDMPYLFNFPVYNNFNIYHSLVSPYYTFYPLKYNPTTKEYEKPHMRYYHALDVPYLYYYYMDPSLFIVSNSLSSPIKNDLYDPNSHVVGYKKVEALDSDVTIYQKDPQLSIGTGFSYYYNVDTRTQSFDDMFLNAVYVQDKKVINQLIQDGFSENPNPLQVTEKVDVGNKTSQINVPGFGNYYQLPVSITKDQSDVVILSSSLNYAYSENNSRQNVFAEDTNGNFFRCYYNFCFIPDAGLKSIVTQNRSIIHPYIVNKNLLNQKTQELKKYSTYDVNINGNTITSKVNNDKPLIMTYKIGYAKGWSVYVDNKKVDTFSSYTGQLSFILDSTGTHSIKLVYATPELRTGIYLTIGSVLVFTAVSVYTYYNKKNKRGNQ